MNRSRILSRVLLLLVALLVSAPGWAVAAPLPGDTFESDDGNLAATVLDWANGAPQVFVDTPSASDSGFTTGAQEDVSNEQWTLVNQPVANKADIVRIYVRSDYPYFRLGVVRNQQATGTGSYNIELNQSTAAHPNTTAVRTAGDVMVIFDFQGNDPAAVLTMHRWLTTGLDSQCAGNAQIPCWGPGTALNATQAVGASNTVTVTDTVAEPDQQLGPRTFDEMAINLEAALGVQPGQCINFGQSWLRTRAGGAFGSALIDLMGPVPATVGNCDVAIEKDVVAVDAQASLNPDSVPFGSTVEYRVRVLLGPDSSPVSRDLLSVTDTTLDAPLVPVLSNTTIVGDDGDNVLEDGERWVYALAATGSPVLQTGDSCADLVNTAVVEVTGQDTNPANDTATRTTPVTCVPDLAVDKSGPATATFGGTITYTVDVSNVGDPVAVPRTQISVSDPLVSGTPLVFATVVTGDADDLLEFGETWRYAHESGAALSIPANRCGPINNTAVVDALTSETNLANNTDTVTTTVTCVPDLAVEKSAPATVAFGGTVTYTVVVSSVGDPLPIDRAALHVTDPAIAGANELEFLRELSGNGDSILSPGERWEYALAGGSPLTATATSCASIDNTAVVVALASEATLSNNESTVATSVDCVPDLQIAKSGPAMVTLGETVTYTIDVTSVGHPLAIPRADVHVTDPLLTAADLVFDSEVSGDGDTLLELGEVWRYSVVAGQPSTRTPTTCGNLVNTAAVGQAVGETNAVNNSAQVVTFVRCPDYAVVKSAGSASVPFSAGSVSWSVSVTNTGNVALPMPSLTDTTVALSGPTSSGDLSDGVFSVGEVLTYSGSESINGRCGQISNTVDAVVVDGQVRITRGSTATTTVVCTPDVAIEKSGPATVDFGSTMSYIVNVTSVGDPLPIPRADLTVTDPAVSSAPLVFASEANGNGDTFLNPGEVWTYALADGPVTLPADRCGAIVNTARVALPGDGQPANDESSVTTNVVCSVNLAIAKTSDKASYAAGETIAYTVTVTNNGQADIPFADLAVSDPMLANLALVGPAPASLVAGGTLTYQGTRTTSIADCGLVRNTVSVALNGDVSEVTLDDNTATRDVTVTCVTDLAIAKAADKATYQPGESITYTVTVTNSGQLPVPFGAIIVADPTLPGLSLSGQAPANLAVGASLTYTGQRVVTAADCGAVPNTATVSLRARAEVESNTANNSASVTVTVAGGACDPVVIGEQNTTLTITKVGPRQSPVRKGIRYTLRVTNTGPVTARGVIVRDPVPAGMTVAKLPPNATLTKRQVRWSIGELAPGQSVTVAVLLRAEGNATRRVCNVGFASATNAPEVNARACTRFTRIAGVVRVPIVTG